MATRVADVRTIQRSTGLDVADDKALVLAFQSGEIGAYSDIYEKYRALASQICYRILQDREESDEAVQETMLRVFRGLPRFNGRYQLQAWVARIATNVSLDMVRARARRPQRGADMHDISDENNIVGSIVVDVSDAIERILDREQVRSTLSEIPQHHREALVLREFEGRSHEEIGDALGVSPQQAKALIHRAKKSFRRAWGEEDRRGIAGLAPILLMPFRLPGLLRKLLQPAHDVVANATASAQQAAIQVTAAPAAAQGAMSAMDKVTAAALTVIVAGTVSVGAIAIRQNARSNKPPPVAASPAPVVPPAVVPAPPVRSRPAVKPHHKPRHHANHPTQAGGATSVPGGTTTDTPSPDPSPSPSGSETPPPSPPPAPTWTGAFDTSAGVGAAHLALISAPRVIGPPDNRSFGETMSGDVVGPNGKVIGSVSLDFTGWMDGSRGSLSTLWLWIDTPKGQYRYTADAALTSPGTPADDGSTTYVFTGSYSLSSVPSVLQEAMPHDGTLSISLGFWNDGSLYATGVSMDES
ncbi:MAG: RNA polymerase sigma factor [Actinomycetota bacterium]